MQTRRALQTLALGGSLIGLSAAAFLASFEAHDRQLPSAEPAEPTGPVRSLIAGGGSTPESNEFSIEEDLLIASQVLPGPTRLLYANGADTNAVRVEAEPERGDPLVAELGRIFAPRSGRSSTYRATRLKPDGPTTPRRFLDELRAAATANTDTPLTVWIAGHGSPAETREETSVAMWGNRTLQARDVRAELSEAQPLSRDVRFVVTTCFGGGFAEVAFDEAGEPIGDGATVCGLFATRWDREAGGCDPNPERGQHDGYGVHFLNALGASPDASTSDIDGDGTVSLLDAHTWARLRSGSLDVPTTTSDRFLRSAVDPDAPGGSVDVDLPHEKRVIEELAPRLGVKTEAEARARIEEFLQRTEEFAGREAAAIQGEADAFHDASAELLAHWPVLDDPWHPEWEALVDDERERIRAFLDASPEIAALHRSMAETDAVATQRAELEVKVAPYMRLARAFGTMRLAGTLKAERPNLWKTFTALRRCEDSPP